MFSINNLFNYSFKLDNFIICFLNLLQLIKSLKKAFEPVLTDVRINWYLPENMEALLSPNEIPPLYPGDCLTGYCTLYDMTTFKAKKV